MTWTRALAILEQYVFDAVLALDSLLVFSVLFAVLYLAFVGLQAACGPALARRRAILIPLLAALAAGLQHSPVGDAVVLVLCDAVASSQSFLGIRFNWPALPALAWLAGVALHLAGLALQCRRLRRELSRLPDFADAAVLAEACATVGIARPARVKAAGQGRQVASWGFLRPWILVPDDFAERFTPAERHSIYLHELTHFQRRDSVRYLVLSLWRACFWFDPACRRATARLRHDFELACDGAVVDKYGADPVEYAGLIMRMAAPKRELPLGFSSGFREIRQRIGRLLGEEAPVGKHRHAVWGALLAAAAVLVLAWFWAAAPAGTAYVHSRILVKKGKNGIVREYRFDFRGRYCIFGAYVDDCTVEEVERRDLRGPDAHHPVLTERRALPSDGMRITISA